MSERVALDLDNVLADTRREAMRRSDELDETFLWRSWSERSKEENNQYRHWHANLWDHHYKEIPPVEDDIDEYVAALNEEYHVDIVTNNTGYDENVEAWLDEQGIEYETLFPTQSQKWLYDATKIGEARRGGLEMELEACREKVGHDGYHYFIDDNPALVGAVGNLYLRDHEWNVDPYSMYLDDLPMTRVTSLEQVVEDLC